MFDLIAIGDCMVDNYFKIHDAQIECNLDRTKCELCIKYASKIGVDAYSQEVAGNATNNAVGVSRLGLKTAFYVNIGSDGNSQKVLEKLREEKIDHRYVAVNKGMDSNTAAIIDFQGERTDLVYHQTWNYMLPDLDRAKWVYFSSLAATFPKTGIVEQLENYLERTGARLAFTPGTYQLKYGVKKFPKLLTLTYILFVNLQEAQTILEYSESETDIKKLLKQLSNLGPQMVVITDGENGSYGFDNEHYYKLAKFPAELKEMTGAGDAYASGTIAGLFYNKELSQAIRWGAANSASVIEYVGPHKGLLNVDQLQERLKKNTKIMAKQI